jgi:predicted PolB exonuclease-like 3'-5' exonuclease
VTSDNCPPAYAILLLVSKPSVRYLVFDLESVADAPLVAKLRYPGESIEPTAAVRRYRDELLAKYETDFIPYTFQVPVSVVAAKVAADCSLIDLVALDEPEFRPHVITEHFWRGWEAYRRPTLVSFNGRTFDIPLLELAAFRFGISLPGWFSGTKSYEQPRNRYNSEAHLDLHDVLTNHGASRFNGGLNLAANLLGKPGKMDVQGDMVQDLYNEGRLSDINDYCRCDVLDTYFVFLRAMVLMGQLTLDREQQLVAQTKSWLEARTSQIPIFTAYLSRWGSWTNPWATPDELQPELDQGEVGGAAPG